MFSHHLLPLLSFLLYPFGLYEYEQTSIPSQYESHWKSSNIGHNVTPIPWSHQPSGYKKGGLVCSHGSKYKKNVILDSPSSKLKFKLYE